MDLSIRLRAVQFIFIFSCKVSRLCLEWTIVHFIRALALLFAHPSIEHFHPGGAWGLQLWLGLQLKQERQRTGFSPGTVQIASHSESVTCGHVHPPSPPPFPTSITRWSRWSSAHISQRHNQHVRLFAKQIFVDWRHPSESCSCFAIIDSYSK